MKMFVSIIVFLVASANMIAAQVKTGIDEKVFVHLNKNQAVTGDVVNYSAYLLSGSSKVSSTMYFELVGPQNNLVLRWWRKLDSCKCSGQFVVPDSLRSGVYQLYAYTYAYADLPEKYKFSTPIVITRYTNELLAYLRYSPDYLGNMFVVRNQKVKGDSAIVECLLNNNLANDNLELSIITNGKAVCTANSDYAGRARLGYIPRKGAVYQLLLHQRNGTERLSALPDAFIPNIIIADSADLLACTIVKPIEGECGTMRLQVVNAGNILIDTLLQSDCREVCFLKDRMQTGMNEFRLSQTGGRKANTCTYFKPYLEICTEADTLRKGAKQCVTLPEILSDSLQSASVSVAVSNLLLQTVPPSNIDGYCYITAETGFAANSRLTVGGTLGNAVGQNADGFEINHKELTFNIIEGSVSDAETGDPLDSVLVIASYTDNSSNFEQTFTNSKGEFLFVIDSMWDNRPIVLQIIGNEFVGRKVVWKLQVPQQSGRGKELSVADSVIMDSRYLQNLNNMRKRSLVGQVLYKSNVVSQQPVADSIASFYNIPDKIVYPVDYMEFNNFPEICANIIPSVKMEQDRKHGYRFSIVITETQMVAKEDVLVLLNGIPFSNYAYIAMLTSEQVKRVDVFNSVFMYGHLKYNGAIAIYTYNQDITSDVFNNPAYVYSNTTNAVSVTRQPKYRKTPPVTDLCVYWNADITPDGLRKISLDDVPQGTYQLTLNGISCSGKPVSFTKYIVVQ